jgi:MtN3 and saliva related transmembrane protein
MIQRIIPWIGICAAVLTSLSYIPQVQKAWPRGSTKDLSLHMLLVLTAGLLLWVGYGLLKSDWVIVAANSVGATLSAIVLVFKIRDLKSVGNITSAVGGPRPAHGRGTSLLQGS